MDINVEFSRPLDLEKNSRGEQWQNFSATTEECEKLAKRFAIVAIENLSGRYRITHPSESPGGVRRLEVSFQAAATQPCGVSLEEVEEKIESKFSIQLVFRQSKSARDEEGGKEIDFEFEEDDREILASSEIDLGEYVAQYLSLSLSSYPRHARAKGDELGHEILQEDDSRLRKGKDNPFNVLKTLKH